jgi:cytochrome c-type biogenesis protein CcmH/NrfF
LPEDLRREIREQIKAGKSDQEILAYATQRYGDFILYNPPVKATTLSTLVRTILAVSDRHYLALSFSEAAARDD